MNIFVFDRDADEAAWMMDDLRLGKMLIESGQLLATGLRERGATDEVFLRAGIVTSKGTPWKSTHRNHPCAVWTRATYGNFRWLSRHAIGLAECFSYRRGKEHACEQAVRRMHAIGSRFFPAETGRRFDPRTHDLTMTPFVLAMPDEYKSDDPVESYRAYLHSKENVKWNDEPPSWWGQARYVEMVDSLRQTAEMAEVN